MEEWYEGLKLFLTTICVYGFKLLIVWLSAKIVIKEIKKEFFTYNVEAEQWTTKDQHRAEWEQWKAQREFEEFEQWKRQKDESSKA